MHFGLRGRQDHHEIMVEDFSIRKDDVGGGSSLFPKTLASYSQQALYRREEVPCCFV